MLDLGDSIDFETGQDDAPRADAYGGGETHPVPMPWAPLTSTIGRTGMYHVGSIDCRGAYVLGCRAQVAQRNGRWHAFNLPPPTGPGFQVKSLKRFKVLGVFQMFPRSFEYLKVLGVG